MDAIAIEDLVGQVPILKERDFREAVAKHDWGAFRGKDVLIRGCGRMVVPAWAYMMVATRLQAVANAVFFGDATDPIAVWKSSNGTS